MRDLAIRAIAVFLFLALELLLGGELGPLGGLALSVVLSLAFCVFVVFLTGAGRLFVLSSIACLTVLAPLSVLFFVGYPVYGSVSAVVAALLSSVGLAQGGFQLLLPLAVTAGTMPVLERTFGTKGRSNPAHAHRP